jgi:septum formation protein
LQTLGIPFEVRVSSVDEQHLEGEAPTSYVRRVAGEKALDVARGYSTDDFVLGADTIVVIDGELLGKPEDDAASRGMLRMLAGRVHDVTTGVALCRVGHGLLKAITVTTRVHFRPITYDEVERYIATGEGRDKAGGYAVQGMASGFVVGIEGSYANVVGLPAMETIDLLVSHGAIREWPPRDR